MTAAWYVASFRHKQYALLHLGRQGFGTWCPSIAEERIHHGRIQVVSRPLFGQYVLVSFDIELDPWQRINNTIGVNRLLLPNKDSPKPLALPTEFVTRMMEMEALNILTPKAVLDLARGYSPGDFVDIRKGTYAGHGAHFLRADYKKGLIIVLLHILGAKRHVSIEPHCIDPKTMVMLSAQQDRKS